MIKNVLKKNSLLVLLILLLKGNENLASVKYTMCYDGEFYSSRYLCSGDNHEKMLEGNNMIGVLGHKCDKVMTEFWKVYDNEFYNFICTTTTDNYLTYIFFCLLENILSECSGVYFRKRVNRHFGFFYGTEIGFFSKSRRRTFTNKYFTISFLKELKFNVISALMYITKTIIHVGDGERYPYWKGMEKYIRYVCACIPGINGFHIIHVNFLKKITFNFINILKIVALIISHWSYNLGSNMKTLNTRVGHKRGECNAFKINEVYGREVELRRYHVFNWLFNFEEIDDGLFYTKKVKVIERSSGLGHKEEIDRSSLPYYEKKFDLGYYETDCELYKVVVRARRIRHMNIIVNICIYIWYILSPSISFDGTTIF